MNTCLTAHLSCQLSKFELFFVEAKDLRVGESLMPFYRDRKKIKSNTNGDYERIWDSAKQEWVFTHRMVTDLLNDFNVIENFTFNENS